MKSLSIGTWLSIPSEAVAEIFANAGYEWIVIDLEHSVININQAERLIRVIDLAGAKPLVRLSGHDSSQIKRVLDAGAKGILAPMVETQNQIQQIISACHYPPSGIRGMGLARAQGYGEKHSKMRYINDVAKNIEIYAQIESEKGVKNAQEIFSNDINGYFIGPYDLSASLGNPGDFNSENFQIAEAEILSAAKNANIKCGYHLVEPIQEQILAIQKKGYNMIAFSVDIRMIDFTSRLPFETE